LPPVIDASHTTPITRVNQGPKLLKSVDGDIIHVLGGSCIYPRSRPQFPGTELGRTVRYSVTVIVTIISL